MDAMAKKPAGVVNSFLEFVMAGNRGRGLTRKATGVRTFRRRTHCGLRAWQPRRSDASRKSRTAYEQLVKRCGPDQELLRYSERNAWQSL